MILGTLSVVWAATAQSPDSAVYHVLPASRLDVHTGRAGLLGGLGHEHHVTARAVHGQIVHVRANPDRSSVVVVVCADSLEILTDAKPTDVAKMTRAMREETLRVTAFPEISFASREATPIAAGLRVSGDFTMVGRARAITVDVALEVAGDTLRARARFPLKQTDFGIKPYGTALGTVRVKDEVWLDIEVVAARVR
jgi:polyisoprenoid-binding protein YceI